MTAMLRSNRTEKTLLLFGFTDMTYNPDTYTLSLSDGKGHYDITNVSNNAAERIIRTTFNNGKIDLSGYTAAWSYFPNDKWS